MKCTNCDHHVDTDGLCEGCARGKASPAVDLIRALASGDMHRGESVAEFPSMHLRTFVESDGKLRCFLRELARYVDRVERLARKDQL